MEREDAAILLGVRIDASKREVRSAFRKCVRTYHPDSGSNKVADFAKLSAARDLMLTPAPKVVDPLPTEDHFHEVGRPVPKPSTIEYGYDANATASWAQDPEPFITRPGGSIGAQKLHGKPNRPRMTTVISAFFVMLFVLFIGIALVA